ncbi:MAG: PCMD domain-containing protein [Clostridium sp.]|nr:PCMD domain-containing protein [Prevotella sp.]MCM1428300.1 PCMD domain-containing protein [Clostridium sp.]MCM1474772.1 PCMD domain-containing protein [Muribaculaceae bacterium]
MRIIRKYILKVGIVAILLIANLTSCIKNDLPYPIIEQYITAIAAEGENKPAVIDDEKYTVTLYLGEDVDIRKVTLTEFDVTEGAEVSPNPMEGTLNLSTPMVVNVSRWQNYQWVIKAEQTIERYLTISGQIGATVIDEVGHRIIINMPNTQNLANCELLTIKLGPEGFTTMSPDLKPGPINLSRPLRVAVTCWGRTEDWTIYTEKTEMLAQTTQVDAWSQVIWAYGSGPAELKGHFQYRLKGSPDWIDVPEKNITQEEGAGTFSCFIPHLEPLTSYEVRALAGEHEGNVVEVKTESTEILPDGSFDQWWLNGRIWCPWNEGGVQFWDTGNKGAATLGQSNVTPSDDTPTGSGKSAKLETKFVGIAGIGKLAAGSIYSGEFVKVDGTNGILAFGRPWKVRPTKLRGYMKFTTAPINYASTEYKYLLNRPDSCHIYVAMTDWTAPFEIRTNPKNRQLFDKNSSAVIAFGDLILGSDTDGWVEFTIEFNYRSTSRKPSYLLITSAASKYGDFFTGGAGTTLYVDQYSLEYDY